MLGGGGGAASLADYGRPNGERGRAPGKGTSSLFFGGKIWPRCDGSVARGLVVPSRAWGSGAAACRRPGLGRRTLAWVLGGGRARGGLGEAGLHHVSLAPMCRRGSSTASSYPKPIVGRGRSTTTTRGSHRRRPHPAGEMGEKEKTGKIKGMTCSRTHSCSLDFFSKIHSWRPVNTLPRRQIHCYTGT
jgi:hypothetical protein